MLGPKKRPNFTSADIEQHLAQISLDLPSSSLFQYGPSNATSSSSTFPGSREHLESLAPLLRTLTSTSSEQLYLRRLDAYVAEKEAEIERICGENYEDFAAAIGGLGEIRKGVGGLKSRIRDMDTQMVEVGRDLSEKKRELLQQRKIARNIDDAIETLQTALRLLDLVNRVREMTRGGKYFAALRALENIQSQPPSSISQTPFYDHILSSLPSLHNEIKTAVTASEKTWLLDIRQSSGQVGNLALEQMEIRSRKWKQKRERDPGMRTMPVGGAIELVNNDKVEFDPLQNATVSLDFKPLLQCIYIYDSLGSRSELQRSYQEDRKGQLSLILSSRTASTSSGIATSFATLFEELVGFFLVEQHVLRITGDFRSRQQVSDLWEEACKTVVEAVGNGLKECQDPDVFLSIKAQMLLFEQTIREYDFATEDLTALLLKLFERYLNLLERRYSTEFNQIVAEDDNLPMTVKDHSEFEQVVSACWLATGEAEQLALQGFPQQLPFSQTFPMCCINVRNFVDQFYQFVEDVPQRNRNVDELLRKSLDGLLISHVSKSICNRLKMTNNLSQIAQSTINLEHFAIACFEIPATLSSIQERISGHATLVQLQSGEAFRHALSLAQQRINDVIASKLDDFFEMAEYDWTPPVPQAARRAVISGVGDKQNQRQSTTISWQGDSSDSGEPSIYLFEMITFLTAYVDSVLIMLNEDLKVKTYRAALEHVNKGLLDFLIGSSVPKLNERALKNLVNDINFIEKEIKRLDRPGLDDVFDEIKSSIHLILSEAVNAYVAQPSLRTLSYPRVKPRNLKIILEKLARWVPDPRGMTAGDAERVNRRRKEAEAVARLI